MSALPRHVERARRKREVRPRSISTTRALRALALGRELYVEEHERPRTRAECVDAPRPCPFVSCKHHLYLDVSRVGSVKLNFPDVEAWEMAESCVLDVAARGGESDESVGAMMNLTRERVRQIEIGALAKLAPLLPSALDVEDLDESEAAIRFDDVRLAAHEIEVL